MSKKSYTWEQRAQLLAEIDGAKKADPALRIADAAKSVGIHETQYYAWKRRLSRKLTRFAQKKAAPRVTVRAMDMNRATTSAVRDILRSNMPAELRIKTALLLLGA